MAFVAENLNYIKRVQRRTGSITASNSSSTESDSSDSDSNEYTAAKYPGILDSDLTTLTTHERVGFIVTVSLLFTLSLCGNIGTLRVNFRRKIRPFFRACLISLALSDLLNTVFLTVAYLGQFAGEYVQVWLLGRTMCHLVPFATTAAILASSMTLVSIALDRYFAVMKAVINFWSPGVIFCVLCTLSIWAVSVGIASPVIGVYDLYPVYVLEQQSSVEAGGADDGDDDGGGRVGGDDAMVMSEITATTMDKATSVLGKVMAKIIATTKSGRAAADTTTATTWEAAHKNLSYTLVKEEELVDMCVSDQREVAVYYVIVFGIIFIPCIVAFICLNTVIARQLWIRRHSATLGKQHTRKSTKMTSRHRHKCKSHKHNNCIKMQPKVGGTQTVVYAAKVDENQLDANSLKAHCQCHMAGLRQGSSGCMPSSVAATLGGGSLKTPNKPATTIPIENNTDVSNTRFATHSHSHYHSHSHSHSHSHNSHSQSHNHNHSHNHNNSHNHNHRHSHSHSHTSSASNRESRHRRMFAIILLLMAVFLFFRLPAWIFLIMRVYGSYSSSLHWILYFSFGILNLTSCVLNPLFYTFLPETVQCVLFVKVKIFNEVCGLRTCYEWYRQRNAQLPAAVSVNYGGCGSAAVPTEQPKANGGRLCCCNCLGWLPMARIKCGPLVEPTHDQSQPQWRASVVLKAVDDEILGNNDEDEGVECSDASGDDESSTDFYDHSQRIYTIFPPALVSSSVTSELQN